MKFAKKDKRSVVEKVMDEKLEKLCKDAQTKEEVHEAIGSVDRWQDIKAKKHKMPVSWETIAIIAGNLLGIALILNHERVNVVTSKALGFVMKGRV
jgi:hypothetical protein